MTEQLHALLDSFRKPINNDRFNYSYERSYNDIIDDIQRRLANVSPGALIATGDASEAYQVVGDALRVIASYPDANQISVSVHGGALPAFARRFSPFGYAVATSGHVP